MSIVRVAKAAGVSTATVSRVMNDLPGVRSETIALVRAAIEELNYKPRRSNGSVPAAKPRGRRGRRGASIAGELGLRTGNIAVVTVGYSADWFQWPVLGEALGGIRRGVGELGLRLILDEMGDPFTPTPLMTGKQVDGVILFMPSEVAAEGERVFDAISQHVPVVWAMGTSVANVPIDHITTDNVAIGQLAVTHLRDRGCRRIGFLTSHPEWALSRARGQSLVNRASDDALDATCYLVSSDAKIKRQYGAGAVATPTVQQTVDRLCADIGMSKSRFGLFVCTDAETARVMPLIAEKGLTADADFDLLSCDNETVRLDPLQPRPLSIDTGAGEIGFRAVVRLLARIQRPEDRTFNIMIAPSIGSR